MIEHTVCFTGHRPSRMFGYGCDNDTIERYVGVERRLIREIEHLSNIGYDTFISGGAQGFDQIAFSAVSVYKKISGDNIKNILYIPFVGYGDNWSQYGLFGKSQYSDIIDHADDIVYVSDMPDNKYEVIRALYDRNKAMADNSSAVIACWNSAYGDWHSAKGGTAQCLRYCERRGMNIILDWNNIIY